MATDATWRCADKDSPKWTEVAFDDGKWPAVEVIAGFEDSLWFKHQNGPPLLETAAVASDESRIGSLAMSWYNHPGVLPFDTRPGEASPAGWYRFTAAPGAR